MYILFISILAIIHTDLLDAHIVRSSIAGSPQSNHGPWYGVINKKDAGVAAAVSAAFYGGSFLAKDSTMRTAIQATALLFPLIRLFSTTKIVKGRLNSCPGINYLLGCDKKNCQGICDYCIAQHALAETGMGVSLLLFKPCIDALVKKMNNQKKKIVQKNDRTIECDICCEDKLEKYCAPLRCCNNKIMCGSCIKNYYNHNQHKNNLECPFCRKDFNCMIPEDELDEEVLKKDTPQSPVFPRSVLTGLIPLFMSFICYDSSKQSISVINRLVGCDNQESHSVCAQCKLRHAQKGAAVFIGALVIYAYIFGAL